MASVGKRDSRLINIAYVFRKEIREYYYPNSSQNQDYYSELRQNFTDSVCQDCSAARVLISIELSRQREGRKCDEEAMLSVRRIRGGVAIHY